MQSEEEDGRKRESNTERENEKNEIQKISLPFHCYKSKLLYYVSQIKYFHNSRKDPLSKF